MSVEPSGDPFSPAIKVGDKVKWSPKTLKGLKLCDARISGLPRHEIEARSARATSDRFVVKAVLIGRREGADVICTEYVIHKLDPFGGLEHSKNPEDTEATIDALSVVLAEEEF